jgi:hypothetical protein
MNFRLIASCPTISTLAAPAQALALLPSHIPGPLIHTLLKSLLFNLRRSVGYCFNAIYLGLY